MTNSLFLFSALPIQLPKSSELAYMIIYVVLACMVYLVMVKRTDGELDRKVVDGIFFTMLGASGLIWMLSKIPPIS